MCTLAILRGVSRRYPLLLAANRDEFYAREATPPAPLVDLPGVVAGRDLVAGGTWLGCRTDHGPLMAAVLNRRAPDGTASANRGELSRGKLCLRALEARTVRDACERVAAEPLDRYGPFNLLLADLQEAVVVDNRGLASATVLDQGLSVLTNLDVNDPRCPRLATAVGAFQGVRALLEHEPGPEELVAACARVMGGHDASLDPDDRSPFSRLCVHTETYGTRSATIVLVESPQTVHYYHADGPPCSAGFRRIPVPSPSI